MTHQGERYMTHFLQNASAALAAALLTAASIGAIVTVPTAHAAGTTQAPAIELA